LKSWWMRSLPAHIGRELLLYLFLFYVVHLFFRVGMNDQQQLEFTGLAVYFSKNLSYLAKDMVFLLGFFVKQIVARWWSTWEAVPLPDPLSLICHSIVEKTPKGKRWAARINRYCLLSYVLCLRRISRALQRMFPSDQSLTDCGLIQQKELEYLRSEDRDLGRVWWLPLSWCMTLIKKTKEEKDNKVIESEQKILVGGILKYHSQLERVDGFDHVIFPPVYHQVVTFAIYAYFSLSLLAEQVEKGDVLDHFPGLLILKFIFAFGWLEVFFHKNAYPGTKRRKLLSSRLRRRSKVRGDQILMTSRCATWSSGIFGRWEKTSTSGKDHLRRRRGRTRRTRRTRRTMRRRLRRRGE